MSDEGTSKIKFIDKDRRRIEIILGGLSVEFPLNPIPDVLYEAMADVVNVSSKDSELSKEVLSYSLMKPTISSLNASNIFPINSAKKITRLTLTDEALEDSIHELEGEILAFQGKPFEDTIEEKMELYQRVMIDNKKIDRFRIGAVEMYGEKTYQNIRRDPRVTLNTFWLHGEPAEALSYQINCIAEIVPPGTPYFRYMSLMRSLFIRTYMDLRDTSDYVCAYKLWVCEIREKSLTTPTGFVPD